ncbi:hypothetical protein [Lyticum sinuosum]|uniref:Uncharacterized protein n=1 Tax=Lyticum sinuosum TaxID=1332059 RepID=A0AAE5AHD2_9RICK|nr:hypothetical protein [Lyticum sinuosum]MDZ5760876.1 hypothetical protein [Lyticum sinuosum]
MNNSSIIKFIDIFIKDILDALSDITFNSKLNNKYHIHHCKYNNIQKCNIINELPNNINYLCCVNCFLALNDRSKIYNFFNGNGYLINIYFLQSTIKNLMDLCIKTDIEIYNGVYQRFITLPKLSSINTHKVQYNVKYNQYEKEKLLAIEKDSYLIKYNSINELLSDLKYLGIKNTINDINLIEEKFFWEKIEYLFKKENNNNLLINYELIGEVYKF